ncbi:TrkA C-terminal domain-containing protein [Virgibacillus subterraneus]|nr:TrkA C-terminal domain-containing protein [Virgibacillus subterraneus]
MHIYKYEKVVIPHRNTTLEHGDRILVSGAPEDLGVMTYKF